MDWLAPPSREEEITSHCAEETCPRLPHFRNGCDRGEQLEILGVRGV